MVYSGNRKKVTLTTEEKMKIFLCFLLICLFIRYLLCVFYFKYRYKHHKPDQDRAFFVLVICFI